MSNRPPPIPVPWAEKIVNEILRKWGQSAFREQWGQQDLDHVIGLWAEELGGFAPAELGRGVAAIRTSVEKFPPLLGEFQGMCRPWMQPATGMRIAIEQLDARKKGTDQWPHPAIYWTATTIGEHTMHVTPAKDLLPIWRETFLVFMSRDYLDPIPAAPNAVPALPAPNAGGAITPERAEFLALVEEMRTRQPTAMQAAARRAGFVHIGEMWGAANARGSAEVSGDSTDNGG